MFHKIAFTRYYASRVRLDAWHKRSADASSALLLEHARKHLHIRDVIRMPINRTNLEDDYRELDLQPGATLEEVRTSYRELALFWHPDRRKDGSGRATSAHQRMTRINLAYERLRKALSAKSHSRPGGTGRPRSEDQRPRTKTRPPEAESQQQQPREIRTNTLGMRFVSVPGISVLFSIWETRVQDYKAFAEATPAVDESWASPGFAQTPAHPVVKVSWEDATRFCIWLTEKERHDMRLPAGAHYRLPTDAEWSWAVGIGRREGSGTPKDKGQRLKTEYPWGTAWPPPRGVGNYAPSLATDSFEHTSPVGSFAANAQGLFDMGGNVWEWCEDFLDGKSGVRVLRGASWNFSSAGHLLSSYRNGVAQAARSNGIGFRIVMVPG